jgi:hypothetical protein
MIVRALGSAVDQLSLAEALTMGQQYSVIGIEADDYRLLNDAGRPYLYPAGAFQRAPTKSLTPNSPPSGSPIPARTAITVPTRLT